VVPARSGWTVLRASRLIDGAGTPPVADPTIVVRDGRICEIVKGGDTGSRWPPDADVLDLRGQTLLPGLIDAHVHLVLPGDGTPFETTVREPQGVLAIAAAENARRALAAGITTLRDCGGMRETTLDLRRAQHLGGVVGPRLHLCGRPITITGGHCWYFGGEADGIDGVRAAVRGLIKSGVDYIKIMATGGGTIGTMSWRPSYTAEELRAAVEEAHRLGRRVGVHSLCAAATRQTLDAGADQIEHANFIVDPEGHQEFEPEVADAIARAGTPVTTTLSVGHYVIEALSAKNRRTPEEQATLDRWRRMLQNNLDQAGHLRAAGVRLIAGTDAGWRFTPFDGLVAEMELLCEAGAAAGEAIAAATSAAADAMGIAAETGALRVGLAADIISVAGDPLADLAVLRRPEMVMLAGSVVHGGPGARGAVAAR
jgi:imidazolonepropionase-like amidohydrolase